MHVPYSVGLDDDVAVVMTSTLVITKTKLNYFDCPYE